MDRRAALLAWWTAAAAVPLFSLTGRALSRWIRSWLSPSHLALLMGAATIAAAAAALLRSGPRPWFRIAVVAAMVAMGLHLVPSGEERFHFLLFGLLGYLGPQALGRGRAVAACLLISVGDELFQWWLPYRVGDPRDVAMDVAASLVGIALACGGFTKSIK